MLGTALRRYLGLATAAFVVLVAGAGPASASTTVAWTATLAEPIGGLHHSPFDCPPDSGCGSGHGQVIGLGHAHDLIVFGACGSGCDVRWLTFTDGSTIVMHEVFSNEQSPGNSNHPDPVAVRSTETRSPATSTTRSLMGPGASRARPARRTALST